MSESEFLESLCHHLVESWIYTENSWVCSHNNGAIWMSLVIILCIVVQIWKYSFHNCSWLVPWLYDIIFKPNQSECKNSHSPLALWQCNIISVPKSNYGKLWGKRMLIYQKLGVQLQFINLVSEDIISLLFSWKCWKWGKEKAIHASEHQKVFFYE